MTKIIAGILLAALAGLSCVGAPETAAAQSPEKAEKTVQPADWPFESIVDFMLTKPTFGGWKGSALGSLTTPLVKRDDGQTAGQIMVSCSVSSENRYVSLFYDHPFVNEARVFLQLGYSVKGKPYLWHTSAAEAHVPSRKDSSRTLHLTEVDEIILYGILGSADGPAILRISRSEVGYDREYRVDLTGFLQAAQYLDEHPRCWQSRSRR